MNSKSIGKRFEELVTIVERLRGPDGCPWDREQTPASLLPYLLEETYEVMESVDDRNWEVLQEELGDLLLHVVFQASIATDSDRFNIDESLKTVNEKLVRRHPHVFGDTKANAAFKAKQNWEAEKQKEKKRDSRLDGVPVTLPGLVRAQRLQEKAAYVGFDWEKIESVWEKVYEELQEIKLAQQGDNKDLLEEEIGDAIFTLVNLARFLGIPAEDALRKTNNKFINRFKMIEKELKKRGKTLEESSLDEMDEIWNEVKRKS
ncbi:MAG: nucleoside triphosphate pyrophosphohydrolase [Candidatus Neomarinimicrobiota bacterium]